MDHKLRERLRDGDPDVIECAKQFRRRNQLASIIAAVLYFIFFSGNNQMNENKCL